MKKYIKKFFKSLVDWFEYMSYPECPECGGSLRLSNEGDKTVAACDTCKTKYPIEG
nr:hypothetical protein [uncultured Macellibacteroides sp.]